jgi:hypothetical protein
LASQVLAPQVLARHARLNRRQPHGRTTSGALRTLVLCVEHGLLLRNRRSTRRPGFAGEPASRFGFERVRCNDADLKPILPDTPVRGWSILTTIEDFDQHEWPQRGGGLRPSFHRIATGHGVQSSLPTEPGHPLCRRIDRCPTLRHLEMNEAASRGGFTFLSWASHPWPALLPATAEERRAG